MTLDLSNPHLKEALHQAGMSTPSADVIERLTFACHEIEGGADAVLEISQADWATEEQGTDVLAVQTRSGLLLVGKGKRGRFKPLETFGIRAPFDYYQDVAEDDEMAGASVFFLPKDGHKPFLLSWRDADERHRMFQSIFQAHRGHYEKWGLQLDPANFVADFDRFYTQSSRKDLGSQATCTTGSSAGSVSSTSATRSASPCPGAHASWTKRPNPTGLGVWGAFRLHCFGSRRVRRPAASWSVLERSSSMKAFSGRRMMSVR
jgi:hypothetical protein